MLRDFPRCSHFGYHVVIRRLLRRNRETFVGKALATTGFRFYKLPIGLANLPDLNYFIQLTIRYSSITPRLTRLVAVRSAERPTTIVFGDRPS